MKVLGWSAMVLFGLFYVSDGEAPLWLYGVAIGVFAAYWGLKILGRGVGHAMDAPAAGSSGPHRPFLYYGALILAAQALACWRGWSPTSTDEVKDVPKSVRDNPGSYRSSYTSHTHYFGGK